MSPLCTLPDLPYFRSTSLTDANASGAGLSGLLLALVLQKDCPDVKVDIYESTQDLTEVGAGIGVWPRIWEILRYLGLEDALRQGTGATRALSLHM